MSKYTLRSDTVLDEQGISHTVYGVNAPTAQMTVRDLFYQKAEAKAFIKKCNKFDLSPLHFRDVIDDILNDDDL